MDFCTLRVVNIQRDVEERADPDGLFGRRNFSKFRDLGIKVLKY